MKLQSPILKKENPATTQAKEDKSQPEWQKDFPTVNATVSMVMEDPTDFIK